MGLIFGIIFFTCGKEIFRMNIIFDYRSDFLTNVINGDENKPLGVIENHEPCLGQPPFPEIIYRPVGSDKIEEIPVTSSMEIMERNIEKYYGHEEKDDSIVSIPVHLEDNSTHINAGRDIKDSNFTAGDNNNQTITNKRPKNLIQRLIIWLFNKFC